MKVGDRVRVVGGIWFKEPTHDPVGTIVAIHSDKMENDSIQEISGSRNVVSVEYDQPPWEDGRKRQSWYPEQLEVIP